MAHETVEMGQGRPSLHFRFDSKSAEKLHEGF